MLKDCIAATMKRKEYTVTSTRNSRLQEHGKLLIDLFEDESRCTKVELFSMKLMCEIETVALCAKKKEKVLTAFHHFRISRLPKLWQDFCCENDVQETLEPLLYQTVSQSIFQDYFLDKIHTAKGDQSSEAKSFADNITLDEENVIRFIAGYIPHTILKNLKRRKSSEKKVQAFTECLLKLAVDGPEESLLAYTTEWMKLIDRGGLFHVSDESFLFFKAMEIKFRQVVTPVLIQPSSSVTKSDTIKQFIDDEVIRFHWDLLAIDIENEDDSEELMTEIVSKWINMHSVSTLDKLMEDIKVKNRTEKKKSKKKAPASYTSSYKKQGLRRSLLQQYEEEK